MEKRTALRRRVLCDEKAINSENCIAIDSEKLSPQPQFSVEKSF